MNPPIRQIILDTETTGLDTETARILELACIEVVNMRPTGRTLQIYFNPGCLIPQESIEIHGITDDFVKDMPPFKERVDEIVEFLRGAQLVIHNAQYDMRILDAELARIDRPPLETFIHPDTIDTLKIARSKFPPSKSVKLDSLCDYYKIDRTRRVKHSALLDCELLLEVWRHLNRTQSTLDFGDGTAGAGAGVEVTSARKRPIVRRPTAEELEAHEKYLDEMEKSSKTTSLFRLDGDDAGGSAPGDPGAPRPRDAKAP